MSRHLPVGEFLALVTGFVTWSLAFVALYGLHSLGCEHRWPADMARGALIAAWLGHAAVAAAFLLWTLRRRGGEGAVRFVREAALALAAAAAIGTLWLGMPVLLADLCS